MNPNKMKLSGNVGTSTGVRDETEYVSPNTRNDIIIETSPNAYETSDSLSIGLIEC